jgi:hypothetical protein
MSVIQGFPHKFQRPQIGDVFQREQQDGRWEYGQIVGVRETRLTAPDGSVRSEWLAHLTNGWVDFRDVIRSDTAYSATEDWHPAGPSDLVKTLNLLEARIAVLEAGPAPVAPAPRPSRSVG